MKPACIHFFNLIRVECPGRADSPSGLVSLPSRTPGRFRISRTFPRGDWKIRLYLSAYDRVFQKRRNIPIVLIGNAALFEGKLEFHALIVFPFLLIYLTEERVIATLYGCIQRRLALCSKASADSSPSSRMTLKYNDCSLVTVMRPPGGGSEFERSEPSHLVKGLFLSFAFP